MKLWVLFLSLVVVATAAYAQDDVLIDPQLEARAVAIGDELRCVVCQSESINSSQADMARDMRVLIREKITQGWTDQEILDFAQHRYGDFILLRPPVQKNTYLLWLLPLIFFVLAATCAAMVLQRKIKAPS